MSLEGVEAQLQSFDFLGLEKIIGTELSIDFKEHYMKYNGGFPSEESAEVNMSPLHGFYSIKYGTFTIETLLEDYADQDITFGKKIPFAYDAGDNLFLLSLENDETYGNVFFIGHEFVEEQEYQFVSNSFMEFVNIYAKWL